MCSIKLVMDVEFLQIILESYGEELIEEFLLNKVDDEDKRTITLMAEEVIDSLCSLHD